MAPRGNWHIPPLTRVDTRSYSDTARRIRLRRNRWLRLTDEEREAERKKAMEANPNLSWTVKPHA